jgi:hypothetical protein
LLTGGEQTGENRHGPCEDETATARNVPKRDSSARSEWQWQIPIKRSKGVSLVPVTPSAQPSQTSSRPSRPSSIFVTHLIATAAQAPQTRNLRRATPADANTAYSANQHAFQGAGFRTRQTI